MTRRELVSLYRAAVLGVDLTGRTERAAERVIARVRPRRVAIVAAGKSAGPMADAAVRAIRSANVAPGPRLVVVPDGGVAARTARTRRASHPIPDARSVDAGRAALALAEDLDAGDLLLVLVSGGASAVLAAPRPGIGLRDKRALAIALLASGKPIAAMNRARTRLSAIKGGGLARAAHRAEVVALVASDVAGDDPAVVGSGPAAGARSILVARPADLLASAIAAARLRGHRPRALEDASRPVGELARRYAGERGLGIAVGEPTLRVTGRRPGGRSQHLALAVAGLAAGRMGFRFLAAGSDGRDGPTQLAGACIDGFTWNRAKSLGFDPRRALATFESTPVIRGIGASIPRWASPVNLQDLHILAATS